MTAASAGRRPKRRGLLLVLVAVVVSATAASATAVALSSRADLSSARRRVDTEWVKLRRATLDDRYATLGRAATAARGRLGADRGILGEIDDAVGAWPGTAGAATDRQVAAAARLEGLARRLVTTVAATPRLRAAGEVTETVDRLQATGIATARSGYNAAVAAYERARGGFPRRLVAGALGYEERRTLEVPA